MCGIAGIILKKKKHFIDLNSIKVMTRELTHRGPDTEDYWISDDFLQYFGHRRLSIIELSKKGNQPMKSINGRYIITFNGEIYNHLEIRENIKKRINYHWQSNSDTETLLSSIEIFGLTETLKLAEGMFAFGLIDQVSKKLYLARDLNGEKPLYYGFQDDDFIFASELKAIVKFPNFKKKLNKKSLKYFLDYSFVPEPYSIFQNINKLEKSSFLEFDLNSKKINKIEKYFPKKNLEISSSNISNNPINLIDKILNRSVKISMTSDVQVGSFLSGGTDSSLITSIMSSLSEKKIETFSVSINKPGYNEGDYANNISKYLKTNHNQIVVGENDLINQTKNLSNMYDEPFADSSQIPTSIISKYASTKVKVILSGDGADEYFCGYNRYLGIKKITKFFEVLPFKIRFLVGQILIRVPNFIVNIIFLILKRINNSNFELNQINEKIYKLSLVLINCKTIEDIYILILKNYFDGKDILVESNVDVNLEKVILKYIEPQSSSVKNMMLIDQNFYLPNDILNKVDRASMFYSLETRVPFLNKDVIDFSNHLPLKFKIRGNNTKWILKELLKKYIPEKYVNRPKMGFSIPLNTWLRGPLKNWSSQNLQFDDDNLVNQNYINLIMNNHYKGKSDNSSILWNLIVLNLWKKKYLY